MKGLFSRRMLSLGRLDGKQRKATDSEPAAAKAPVAYQRGIPDYDYQLGTIKFLRFAKQSEADKEAAEAEFQAFSGAGQSLRQTAKSRKWWADPLNRSLIDTSLIFELPIGWMNLLYIIL